MTETTWKAPADLDLECLVLCEALNRLPGIMTTSSCCGHGREPYRIWVHPRDLDALPALCYRFALCHSGEDGWRVIAYTDCGMGGPFFMIEGPAGAFGASEKIAALISKDIAEPGEDQADA